jgi:hypothetical protein
MNQQPRRKPTSKDPKYSALDFFTYDLFLPAGTTLAPAANVPLTVNIDASADFFWLKATQHATVGNASTTNSAIQIPECNVLITDTGTGYQLMNAQVPIYNLFGTAELPFILPVEKFFGARAQIQVQVFNVSTGTTYSSLHLSLIGLKAYF